MAFDTICFYVILFTLALLGHSIDSTGHPGCPCIKPTSVKWCDSSHRAMHDGSCYPRSFGASFCAQHDVNVTQECVSDDQCKTLGGNTVACKNSKRWCGSRWCFVDPKACSAPNQPADFFPSSGLHYSYETCGNLNEYDPNKHQTFLSNVAPLRISISNAAASGYTVVNDGPPGYSKYEINNGTKRKFGEFGRLGSVVEFFDRVWKDYGRSEYTVVKVSEESAKRYPMSSFTACVHDLALQRTDVCVGNFWPTLPRRLLVSFTSAIYQDTFHLVVEKKFDETTWTDQLAAPFVIFSLADWASIFGFLLFASFVIWMMEGVSNEEDFPEPGAARGLLRSVFNHMQCFFGGGDHRHNPHTVPGRIVVIMTSFVVLFVVTQLTAKMTEEGIRTSSAKGAFSNVRDVIAVGGKICGHASIKKDILQRIPEIASSFVEKQRANEGLKGMDSNECLGAIITADEWAQLNKESANCNKFMTKETLFSQSNAFAMREDLVAPFSWAMTKLQNEGVYSQLEFGAKQRYVETLPDACSATNEELEDESSSQYIRGPVLLAFAVVLLTLLASAVLDMVEARRRDSNGEGDIFTHTSLRQRFLGETKQEMVKRASSHEAMESVIADDRDLKMITKVFEARHCAVRRIQNRIKGDASLTISDVPMLVHLLQQAVKQEGTERRPSTREDLPAQPASEIIEPESPVPEEAPVVTTSVVVDVVV